MNNIQKINILLLFITVLEGIFTIIYLSTHKSVWLLVLGVIVLMQLGVAGWFIILLKSKK